MQNNCCGEEWKTTQCDLERRIKDEKWDFCYNLIAGVIEIVLALLYAYYCRNISINETTYYNNDVSFPFHNLSIKNEGDFSVTTYIRYSRDGHRPKQIYSNKRYINIQSELNVPKLVLKKEFDDYLLVNFKINDNQIQRKKGRIIISNNIYSLDTSNEIKVDPFYRLKYFYIEDELQSSYNEKKLKSYNYFVHARSIEINNTSYNFSMIDENERVRTFQNSSYQFGIVLRKIKFLSHVKVELESFWEKFFFIFGILGFIFQILIPLVLSGKDELRKSYGWYKESSDKQPLRENENKTEIELQRQNLENF